MSEFSKDHYLNSIIGDIRNIKVFTEGMSYDDYADDLKTQYACERAILNISEAARNMEKHGRQYDPDFSLSSVSSDVEWAKIKGIGNVMRHDYENVKSSQIWKTIIEHLDRLEIVCVEALD